MPGRIRILAALSTALALSAAAGAQRQAAAMCRRVYLGTQNGGPGQGIVTASLNLATGQLTGARLVAEVSRPTWLLADRTGTLLYSVSDPRESPGAGPQVLAWRIDRTSGDLQPIGAAASGGRDPTHLALDRRSRTLFVAHYGSGQVAASPLTAGGAPLAPASVVQDVGTGPSPRQTGPHAHAVVLDPTGRYLLSPDLGADRIFVWRFASGTRQLAPAATPFAQLPSGSGPRHIAFSRDGRFAYVVTELSAEVRAYRWDAREGRLTDVQALPLDPPGFAGKKSASEITVSPDGRQLYVADRADGTIATFAIDSHAGTLTPVQRTASGGRVPWSFALAPDGRWMVVTNQGSDTVAVLPRDPRTGRLAPAVASLAMARPVTVAFAGAAGRCL